MRPGCSGAPSSTPGRRAERGLDQRRERLDVGAHHDDVARFEGGVVGEQADDHLAQHLDLARAAVAGVDLDGPVASASASCFGPVGAVVGDPVLERAERGVRPWWGGEDRDLGVEPQDARRELGRVARHRGEQRVRRRCRRVGPCGSIRSGPARRQSASDGCGSHRWTSRCSASASSTRRWPSGSAVAPKTESRAGRSTADGSARSRSTASSSRSAGDGSSTASRTSRHRRGCQRRSSGSGAPRPSSSRPSAQARSICRALHVVGAEQPGDPLRQPEPAAAAHLVLVVAEVAAHRAEPVRAVVRVDRREDVPGKLVRAPRILVGGRGQRVAHQPVRRREQHVRADAVRPRPCPAGGRAAARPSAPRRAWGPRRRPARTGRQGRSRGRPPTRRPGRPCAPRRGRAGPRRSSTTRPGSRSAL